MKIIILGNDPTLYSNKRLIEAGKARGHDIRFINLRFCYMNISADKPEIHYRGGENLQAIDAVIPRIRPGMTFHGAAVVRQFEMMGVYCINEAIAITRSRDKLRTLQLLSRKGMDIPITGFADSPQDTKDLIRMVGGVPLVIKLLEGTQGMGVMLAETHNTAESVINAFKSLHVNILVQEFIKEAEGRDIRCFVIGDKVVSSMQRTAAPGEFRANLHMGGSAKPIQITAKERTMAIDVAKIIGLKVAGVDLIRSKSGPKVLEINSAPGLEGIETTTGKDIAGMIIEYIEKNAHHKKNHRKAESKKQQA